MANGNNLSDEQKKALESYLNVEPSPFEIDEAFQLTPDRIGSMASSLLPNEISSASPALPIEDVPPLVVEDSVPKINQPQLPIINAPTKPELPSVKTAQKTRIEGSVPFQPSPMQKLLDEYNNLYNPKQMQMESDEMSKALDHKKDLALLDIFMKGGSQLASGIAQTKPAQIVEVAGLADIDIAKAKEKSNLSKRQIESLEAQMKMLDVQEMTDPNSPTSKIYRQTLREMAPSIASMPELQNASAKMVSGVYPMVKEKLDLEARNAQRQILLEQKMESLDQRKREEDRRLNEAYTKFADRMQKDKQFQALESQGMNFSQIDRLLDAARKGNEVSVAALGSKMARAMGEVGVLTDADVTRYLGTLSYGRKINSWFEKGMKGQLPKPQTDEIQQVADIMKTLHKEQIMPIYNKYANLMVANYGVAPEEALKKLAAPGYTTDYFNEKPKVEEKKSQFPKQVRKGNKIATVSNEKELKEAQEEGFE